uniref:p0648C09.4 protein n=1 Tax=Oryza sativa subsp. japonica TaxID=39947 RepID=Q8RUP9_ORYSJ|nr:P0648C09.4 [Oryza sativa Japonica Group]
MRYPRVQCAPVNSRSSMDSGRIHLPVGEAFARSVVAGWYGVRPRAARAPRERRGPLPNKGAAQLAPRSYARDRVREEISLCVTLLRRRRRRPPYPAPTAATRRGRTF